MQVQILGMEPAVPPAQPLIEPLSQRELEVLHLIARGLSNDDIGKRLFLAPETVKGHDSRIYDNSRYNGPRKRSPVQASRVCHKCKSKYSSISLPLDNSR